MPIDIEGWIEVKNTDSQKWLGKESLSEYLIMADSNSDYIFDITKIPRLEPVAGSRGLPKDVSTLIKKAGCHHQRRRGCLRARLLRGKKNEF
jgi:hypothetical protein